MCDCNICKRSRSVVELASRLEESEQDLLMGLMNELDHVEMERDYLNAVVSGSWPDSDKVISSARKGT